MIGESQSGHAIIGRACRRVNRLDQYRIRCTQRVRRGTLELDNLFDPSYVGLCGIVRILDNDVLPGTTQITIAQIDQLACLELMKPRIRKRGRQLLASEYACECTRWLAIGNTSPCVNININSLARSQDSMVVSRTTGRLSLPIETKVMMDNSPGRVIDEALWAWPHRAPRARAEMVTALSRE